MYKKTYDNEYLEKLQLLFRDTKQRSYDLLQPHTNETIADIGCGTGQDAVNISKSGAKIFAIDHDQDLINLAVQRYKNEAIEFICCEANSIPIKSNTIDKIRFDRVFQHIGNHDEIIREAKRLLKPKGEIQIIDTDYFSMSIFLRNEVLERKIIDAITYDRFKGASQIRSIPDILRKHFFQVKTFEIKNYIITDFELANYIIRFDKIVNEEFEKGNISSNELIYWEQSKTEHFNLSLNLILIVAIYV